MKFSTKQVSLVPIRVSERTFRDEIGTKSWGIPNFGGIPVVMTSRSRKYVIISPKKSENKMCERFRCAMPMRKKGRHLDFSAHLRISNSNISVFGHYIKPKM